MATEDLDSKQLSKAKAFWIGLIIFSLGLWLLYFDVSGMLHKTEIPFLKRGLHYAQSPKVLFWASGIVWFFLSSYFIYLGFGICKKALIKPSLGISVNDERL